MITSTEKLKEIVDQARTTDAVAIDTEFIWNRTYIPKLGLIQLALSDEECYLIDPLAIDDLSPFGALLADQRVIKIFHDAPQDIAILYTTTGTVPKNIFDTRLAAGFAGLSATLSLGNLIQELLDITLPKTETRTNWLKRPLDKKQITYALDDVRYLRAARVILINRIIGPEIKAWLQEELDLLNFPENYNGVIDSERFTKIRGHKGLNPQGATILQQLAMWREQIAKKMNRPRGHIIKDSLLLELSRKQVTTTKDLKRKTELSAKVIDRWGENIVACIQSALAMPEEAYPKVERNLRLNKKNSEILNRLNEFIQLKCKVQGIDPTLIGNSSELKCLVKILNKSSKYSSLKQLEGWRKLFLKDFFRYTI